MNPQQTDLFEQDSDEAFIERWHLLDSPSPYRTPPVRVCSGLVSYRLSYLKRHGRHREAAELAIAGGIRVWHDAAHWARLYPYPKAELYKEPI